MFLDSRLQSRLHQLNQGETGQLPNTITWVCVQELRECVSEQKE